MSKRNQGDSWKVAKEANDKLKKELQGGKGLISEVRKRFLPSSQRMAELAQEEFIDSGRSLRDVDSALEALLEIEFQKYGELESQFVSNFWKQAPTLTSSGKYPQFERALAGYRNMVRESSDPAYALNEVAGVYSALVASNSQSSKSRSGASLMHHIAYLLESAGFVQGRDFMREVQLDAGSGCKLDFFFPSIEQFRRQPKDCCAVACQTTSNDRFRLTFAQMPGNTRNRACTAIGSKNFGKNLGPNSLTAQKLSEAKSQNIKFVVLASAMDVRLRDSGVVMTYAEWFDELRKLKTFW